LHNIKGKENVNRIQTCNYKKINNSDRQYKPVFSKLQTLKHKKIKIETNRNIGFGTGTTRCRVRAINAAI